MEYEAIAVSYYSQRGGEGLNLGAINTIINILQLFYYYFLFIQLKRFELSSVCQLGTGVDLPRYKNHCLSIFYLKLWIHVLKMKKT